MTGLLRAVRAAVNALIVAIVGLGFLPRLALLRLIALQKFLGKKIDECQNDL